ncbi:FecR family protein [Chitinophaga vietnamensis]|uniref:FecR family protein n=1 Tax=Chitinophaga vietnamensis TaxID=2593957 RepID=UPI001375B83C|nr:FecR family protein [Chitinophaga vietnamensis]
MLQKYLDGTITDGEGEVLFAWLKENPVGEDTDLEPLLEAAYRRSFGEPPALSPAASARILNRLMESTAAPVVSLRRPWRRYAAAVALLLAAAGATFLWLRHPKEKPLAGIAATVKQGNHAMLTLANGREIQLDSAHGNIIQSGGLQVNNNSGELDYNGKAGSTEYHTLTTPPGGQYKLLLPDGTAAWLNAGSSITFPTAFNGKYRQVKMTGEVYFDVKQQANNPFMVDIDGKAAVEVLGTVFNVNAYTDEPTIRTTLLQGSVKMTHQGNSAVLRPGQQAVISRHQLQIADNTDTEMAVAWKDGLFRFDHTPLDEVLRQLARWYNVEIVYEQGVPHIAFSGEIKRNLDLPQTLTVLGTMGVHCKVDGRKLIIMP